MPSFVSEFAEDVSGFVLAGGLSRRMGTDKASLVVGGRRLVDRAVACLIESGCRSVTVLHRSPSEFADLAVPVRADLNGGQGPLDGLVTALETANTAWVVTLPVDLDRIDASILRNVISALGESEEHDAVCLRGRGGDRQHLVGVWRVRRCLGPLKAAFMAGERSPRAALGGLGVGWFEVPDASLHNLNEPSDLVPDP